MQPFDRVVSLFGLPQLNKCIALQALHLMIDGHMNAIDGNPLAVKENPEVFLCRTRAQASHNERHRPTPRLRANIASPIAVIPLIPISAHSALVP